MYVVCNVRVRVERAWTWANHETMSADDDECKRGIEKSYTHGTGCADTVLSLTSVVHAVKNCAHPQPPSPLYCINGRAARLAAAPSRLP